MKKTDLDQFIKQYVAAYPDVNEMAAVVDSFDDRFSPQEKEVILLHVAPDIFDILSGEPALFEGSLKSLMERYNLAS